MSSNLNEFLNLVVRKVLNSDELDDKTSHSTHHWAQNMYLSEDYNPFDMFIFEMIAKRIRLENGYGQDQSE
jgi:hypothetical protein